MAIEIGAGVCDVDELLSDVLVLNVLVLVVLVRSRYTGAEAGVKDTRWISAHMTRKIGSSPVNAESTFAETVGWTSEIDCPLSVMAYADKPEYNVIPLVADVRSVQELD